MAMFIGLGSGLGNISDVSIIAPLNRSYHSTPLITNCKNYLETTKNFLIIEQSSRENSQVTRNMKGGVNLFTRFECFEFQLVMARLIARVDWDE